MLYLYLDLFNYKINMHANLTICFFLFKFINIIELFVMKSLVMLSNLEYCYNLFFHFA